jgi:single-strand DNA-binding protein
MYGQTIIIGNLTKSPELKYIPSGTAVAKCSIAYTDGFGDKKTSHFMDIELWGKTAEAFNQFCHKGSKIMVIGFPKFEQWTAQDGTTRSRHSLRVDTMKMLDSKNDSQSHGGYNPGHQPNSSSNQPEAMNNSIPEIDIDEDEIPFWED